MIYQCCTKCGYTSDCKRLPDGDSPWGPVQWYRCGVCKQEFALVRSAPPEEGEAGVNLRSLGTRQKMWRGGYSDIDIVLSPSQESAAQFLENADAEQR